MDVRPKFNPTALIRCSIPFLTLILSNPAWPVVTLIPDCPEKFIGIVESSKADEGPNNSLSKLNITVEVTKYLSGTSQTKEKKFKVLKYGNLQFVKGNYYIISLNKNHLCMAEKVGPQDY